MTLRGRLVSFYKMIAAGPIRQREYSKDLEASVIDVVESEAKQVACSNFSIMLKDACANAILFKACGEIAGVLRISTEAGARSLRREQRALHWLSHKSGEVQVPRPLGLERLEAGLYLARQTAVPIGEVGEKLTELHWSFLRVLASGSRVHPWSYFTERVARRCQSLDSRPKIIENALALLPELSVPSLPSAAAHGDFTPWNTTISQGELYVYDWEEFRLNEIPWFDALHFVFQTELLLTRSSSVAINSALNNCLANAYLPGVSNTEAVRRGCKIYYLLSARAKALEEEKTACGLRQNAISEVLGMCV